MSGVISFQIVKMDQMSRIVNLWSSMETITRKFHLFKSIGMFNILEILREKTINDKLMYNINYFKLNYL